MQLGISNRNDRTGITLLEVLISIGVVGIGLLGVAALIPLAHHKAAQGIRDDRTSLMGRRAFRELRVRNLERPGFESADPRTRNPYWAWNQPAGNPYIIYNANDRGRLVRQAYCLDPLLSSATGSFRFPEIAPIDIQIPRLTLLASRPEDLREEIYQNLVQSMAPDQANAQAGLRVSQRLNNAPPLLTLAQAEEMFRLQDELVFDRPDDKSQPPFQVYVQESAKLNKRASSGSFSWMVTIVPELSLTSDRYTVSIVVFHRRQLTLNPQQEVVANVDPNSIGPDGLTAPVKQVRIVESSTTPIIDPPHAGVRHIKNGEWVMLVQQRIPGDRRSVMMKWYRVTAADELDEVTERGIDTDRELALQGPDWPLENAQPFYAVYMRNVVAVYEKTIRLHESSLYN